MYCTLLFSVFARISGLLLALVLMACGPSTRDPLRVATLPWPGYETLHLAQSLEYLNEPDIRLVELVNTSQIASALRNGTVAAATITLDSALTLIHEGVDLNVVLVMDYSLGADAVIARPAITTLQHIRGKRIAVENATVGGVMLDALLTEAALSVTDIQLVSMTVNEHLAAYRRGEVDVVVTFEPVSTVLVDEGGLRLYDSRAIPGRVLDVLVVRKELMNRYRPQLQALLKAHFRALDYLQQSPDDAYARIAPYLGVSAEQVATMMAGIRVPSLGDNHRLLNGSRPELVRVAGELADFMVQRQLLRRAPAVDHLVQPDFLPPSNFFTSQFLTSQPAGQVQP